MADPKTPHEENESNTTSPIEVVDLSQPQNKELRLGIKDFFHNQGVYGLPIEVYKSADPDDVKLLTLSMKAATLDINEEGKWPFTLDGKETMGDKSPFKILTNLTIGGKSSTVLWSKKESGMEGFQQDVCKEMLQEVTKVYFQINKKENLIPDVWKQSETK